MKKLLSVLLVAAMVLGLAGTAFAASYPDATGDKYESSILKVSQLGIFQGDNGNFKPTATITRAEFATVMVRALGLEDAAKALAGTPTKFTDVPASHWASGYINIAVAQGVIKGMTPTTFAPESPVTQAEVVTMLVRAIGRDSEATGDWPVGHIMVASSNGLMNGITFAANTPALRDEIAKYIDNTLTKPIMVKDKDGILQDSGTSFLSKVSDNTAYVTGTVASVSTSDNTITIGATTYDLASDAVIFGSTLANLKGNTVQMTKNSDGDITFVKITTSQVIGKVTAIDSAKKTITVGTTVYTVLDAASVTINGAVQAGDAVAKVVAVNGADVTLVLDDNGKVSFITATKLGSESTISAKTSKVVNGVVKNYITVGSEYEVKSSTTIIRNGVAAAYADLKVGDSVKIAVDGSAVTYVDAYGNTVTGVLAEKTTVNGVQRIKVGETYYDVQIDTADSKPLDAAVTAYTNATVGNSVTVTLDRAGKFINIVNATVASQVRTITGTSVTYGSGSTTYNITVNDGSTYSINTTSIPNPDADSAAITLNGNQANFSDLTSGQKVFFSFVGGKIATIDAFVDGTGGAITHTGLAGDTDVQFTDADGVAITAKIDGTTVFTLNAAANKSVADVLLDDTVNFTWDLTNWVQANRATFATNGAILGNVTLVRTTVSGAIVAKGYDGTNNTITVRVGAVDTTYNVKTSSKIEVDGVSGKAYADLAIGQKIKLALNVSDVTFAVVTADTKVPTIKNAVAAGLAASGDLSEDAAVGYKVYKADGTLVKSVTAVAVAKVTGGVIVTWDGNDASGVACAAGGYYLVLTATDAAGNVSTPVSVNVTHP